VVLKERKRLNVNVLELTALVFDIDRVTDPSTVLAIVSKLEASGLSLILHSSHSHTAKESCLRVVFELSRPLLPSELAPVRAVVAERFGLPWDKSTKDLVRLYYLPTHPKGGSYIAEVQPGKALDVDACLHARAQHDPVKTPALPVVAAGAASAPIVEVPTATAQGSPTDLAALRKRLLHVGKAESKALVKLALSGKPLAIEGARDNTLRELTGILAFSIPLENAPPTAAVYELVRKSVESMPGAPVDAGQTWEQCFTSKYERAREKYAIKRQAEAERAEADREMVRTAGMWGTALAADPTQATGASDAPVASPTPDKLQPYTDAQIEQWATEQGWHSGIGLSAAEYMRKAWVIQSKSAYWIFVDGRYKAPLSFNELDSALRAQLARAPFELTKSNASGNGIVPKSVVELLRECSTVAMGGADASFYAQRSTYNRKSEIFHEAVTPLRVRRAVYNEQIHEWLTILGGVDLLDWLADAPDLSQMTCALYFSGVKGAGKTLFASCLSRLWSEGGYVTFDNAVGDFNDQIATNPVIFGDEHVPPKATFHLRALTGAMSQRLNRKYIPATAIRGAVRLVVAANHTHLFEGTSEDLSVNDEAAIDERILHIPAPQAAADYLIKLGGSKAIEKPWKLQDGFAEHVLWLQANHVHSGRGSRFAKEGRGMGDSAGGGASAIGNEIAQFLVRYIADSPSYQKGPISDSIRFGAGKVLVNVTAFDNAETWKKYVPSRDRPYSIRKLGTALKTHAVSTSHHNKGKNYHEIDLTWLYRWAQSTQIVDFSELQARINGPVQGGAAVNRVAAASATVLDLQSGKKVS
jgi:hypothetical protein